MALARKRSSSRSKLRTLRVPSALPSASPDLFSDSSSAPVPETGADLGMWRKAHNLTQEEAAYALACSRTTYRAYEKASTKRLPRSLRLICAAVDLGVVVE